MAGQFSYDGWSCVRRMENNEPPLMQCYSNPKKARLTVEVRLPQLRWSSTGAQRSCFVCPDLLCCALYVDSLSFTARRLHHSNSHAERNHTVADAGHQVVLPPLQGFALAKRLHEDAVGRGAIMALDPGLAVPAAFQAAASSVPVRCH